MDAPFAETLAQGAHALGVALDAAAREKLERYADRLLAWNRKVNLTAITDPAELAEKHLVDSLALVPEVRGAATLLDVGSGAGLPGIPLAIALPSLQVTCCDTVAKKVAFVKAVSAELDLHGARRDGAGRGGTGAGGAAARRGGGEPGLRRSGAVAAAGGHYLAPGGRILATLGREVDEEALRGAGAEAGLVLLDLRRFALPRSGAQRAVATFVRRD